MQHMNRIEEVIFQNLMYNEEFARKVIPHLKKEYFKINSDKIIISEIINFYSIYNKSPTIESLIIDISNRTDVGQTDFNEAIELIDLFKQNYVPQDADWLLESTEKFCKDRALYIALYESMYIYDGKDKNKTPDSIPGILSDALAITFDTHLGHDYLEDWEYRYEFYHTVEEKLPFNLEILNKITDGGLSKKTLTIVMSGPGGGKSLFLCHNAASALAQGKNVLYITMEMSEERISERIDANLFNINIKDLRHLDKEAFKSKIDKIKAKTNGKLKVKEFPTGGAHAGHFRALIEEYKMKFDFTPDLIIIDYLNICSSQRIKNASANSYTIVGSIAEELRGLGIEYNVPVLTATQTKTDGIMASDVDLTQAADSIGIARTADLMFAIIRSEELDELGQVMFKQLKNRYADISFYKRFIQGIDFPRMKFYDVEQSGQEDIVDKGKTEQDKPLFDQGRMGSRKIIDGSNLNL